MNEEDNKDTAFIYSVSKLNEEEIKIICEKFPFLKKTKIINKINPGLLGGIMIKTKDRVFDYSLYNRLVDLKKLIYEIGYR